ncbi:hypothetical protein [Bradyrhizobium sp.]|uniref:hypothetical protein n=1 Tax=Bradyrhizobium sp. TaxID=376 RepID=UPI001EC4E3C6|nr:hypothetical protein [Bradyrhizobium sp.]MBV8916550.1 hypothetical protein [Bradyrhizobium sp.]MBV9982406.1 hypothetical protein [Bradyrhizobium sp.]
MEAKKSLEQQLRNTNGGTTLAKRRKDMSETFGACLSPVIVEAWLSQIGLSGVKVKESGTTGDWVFELPAPTSVA